MPYGIRRNITGHGASQLIQRKRPQGPGNRLLADAIAFPYENCQSTLEHVLWIFLTQQS